MISNWFLQQCSSNAAMNDDPANHGSDEKRTVFIGQWYHYRSLSGLQTTLSDTMRPHNTAESVWWFPKIQYGTSSCMTSTEVLTDEANLINLDIKVIPPVIQFQRSDEWWSSKPRQRWEVHSLHRAIISLP